MSGAAQVALASGNYTITGTAGDVATTVDSFRATINPSSAGTTITAVVQDNGGTIVADFAYTAALAGTVSASDTADPTSANVSPDQTVTPFSKLTITDTQPTETISAKISLPPGYSTSSSTTIAGTAQQVQIALDSFTANSTGTAGVISATVYDASGAAVNTFTFTGQPVGVVSVSDNTDPTSAPVTKNQTVTPLANLSISDTIPTETTISATISPASGYSTSSNLTFTGTAAGVQSDIEQFTATAQAAGPGAITVTVFDTLGSKSTGAGAGKLKVVESYTFDGIAPVVSVTDTTDPTSGTVTPNQTVKPFAHLGVRDTLPSETISATIATSGTSFGTKSVTFTGTASSVQTQIDNYSVQTLPGGRWNGNGNRARQHRSNGWYI